jgi:plasmid stabilization system protein ParE
MQDGLGRELYLLFAGGAYILRYRLEDDTVVIIRVWHGREQRG